MMALATRNEVREAVQSAAVLGSLQVVRVQGARALTPNEEANATAAVARDDLRAHGLPAGRLVERGVHRLSRHR